MGNVVLFSYKNLLLLQTRKYCSTKQINDRDLKKNPVLSFD